MTCSIARAEGDGTCAETRFLLSPKRMSPFKSVGASVQSTAGSRGVRISLSNAGETTLGGGVRVLATHSIRQFPLHFPSRASPCDTRFRTSSSCSDGSEITKPVEIRNHVFRPLICRLHLKCDGTRAETRFRLSAKLTSPFKSAGVYWQPRCAHQR